MFHLKSFVQFVIMNGLLNHLEHRLNELSEKFDLIVYVTI